MNIAGSVTAAGYGARMSNAATSGAKSTSFANLIAAAKSSPSKEKDRGVQAVDFTHMTRKDLSDWVNAKITSGEISLDRTEGFLGMTMKIPVNGAYTGLDDAEAVDFMQSARHGMSWARQHGNAAMFSSLQTALGLMQQYQGTIGRVDLAA
ncbi:hypothetical protein BH11PSE5_BH11PSE5_29480 [soil metagenome]